jgi:alkanesulfonate monooxygenase SsuD/methylene tetrahydromethanopterin reductase-like flavin-dependent oxidoreductase (luciferase family)
VQLPEVEYECTWPEYVEMARIGEDIGLDSLWVGDHLMYRYADPAQAPRGPYESWTTLSALAAITERVTLGHLVASALFHTPPMIAKMAATVDQISNGRFVLGLGAGWHEPEYRGFGIPFDHRFSRFAEAYQVIGDLLTTGESSLDGEFYTIKEALLFPKPVRPEGPPIMIGSFGQKMLELTMPTADWWNAWSQDYNGTFEGLEALLARVDSICEQVGRDPATLVKTVAPLVGMLGARGRLSEYGVPPVLDGTDAHSLANDLHRFAELGIAHVQLVLDPINATTIAALHDVLELMDQ